MSQEQSYAGNVLAKQAVEKYSDSIIRWGGVFRTILTVLGWIYLAGGPLFGYIAWSNSLYGDVSYIFIGIVVGAVGGIAMFGYRLIFDYLLMRAHQSKL
jgi:hypothetical protein